MKSALRDRLEVRLDERHRKMLDDVVEQRGENASEVVRRLIEQEHEALEVQEALDAIQKLGEMRFDVPDDPEQVKRLILEMWNEPEITAESA